MSGQGRHSGSRIVVGVDGSPSSIGALRWAIRQAELTGADVEAVIAWHYPIATGGYGWAPTGMATSFDFNPAQVLLGASDGADLLVVGSRGHGGFTEALLGSVSQHCVHHARCPVS
jgi:nucleotide-binding universal stress UspA family protein